MPNIFTWLHLSDLHATTTDALEQKRCWRALAKDIRSNYARKEAPEIGKPDVVFVTGDVVQAGTLANFRVAREALKVICNAAQVPDSCVYVVPGNHDITRTEVPVADDELQRLRLRLTQVDDLREAVDRFWESDALALLERKFRAYLRFAYNYARVTPGPLGSWVATKDFNGVPVRLCGLNSVWNGGHRTLDAAGAPLVGVIQREVVDNLEPPGVESAVHMVLQHNSTDYLNVIDAILHDAWLGEKDAIMLAGHVHNAQTAERRSVDGRHLSVIGGALYSGYRGSADRSYSIGRLEVEGDQRHFVIDMRKQSPMGSFTNDTGRYRGAPDGRLSFSLSTTNRTLGETEVSRANAGGELRLRRDFVSLHLEDNRYFMRFEKEYVNETSEAIAGVHARLIVNVFPDDAKRSRDYYKEHPFTLRDVKFKAESEGRHLQVKVMHDHDSHKELMLMFENRQDGRFAIEPGESRKVTYTFEASTDIWGPYLERNIRLPTDVIECELSFPAGRVKRLRGLRDPHILHGTAIEPPVKRRMKDGRVIYLWECDSPRLSSRFRLSWMFARPPQLKP
jgi:hypothetical protein